MRLQFSGTYEQDQNIKINARKNAIHESSKSYKISWNKYHKKCAEPIWKVQKLKTDEWLRKTDICHGFWMGMLSIIHLFLPKLIQISMQLQSKSQWAYFTGSLQKSSDKLKAQYPKYPKISSGQRSMRENWL